MNSPFLFQNIIILIVLILIFAASLYLFLSKKITDFIEPRSIILLVLYRAATTALLSFMTVSGLVGASLFYLVEVDEASRDCWDRSSKWRQIFPGMPRKQAVDIMGKAFLGYNSGTDEVSIYCINPVGNIENGTIIFRSETNETELKVFSKTPDEVAYLDNLRSQIPDKSSKTYADFVKIIAARGSFCAFYGLFGLALLSLCPFKMLELCGLRMLYTPVAAMVFKAIYVSPNTESWHFELFPVAPLFTIIIVGWIVRVMMILLPD